MMFSSVNETIVVSLVERWGKFEASGNDTWAGPFESGLKYNIVIIYAMITGNDSISIRINRFHVFNADWGQKLTVKGT